MDSAALEAAGWVSFAPEGFSSTVCPIWFRDEDGHSIVGLPVEPRHCNHHLGTLHGGALMTFADMSLGLSVVRLLGVPRCVTLQLQMQFIATARVGEFVTCRPEILRSSKRLIFVRGVISAGDRIVANADGIWKVFEAMPPAVTAQT